MKTVLFVPGFKEHITSRDYTSTIDAIKKSGYIVEFVDINWDKTTIDNWLATLEERYLQYNPSDVILAGFSFGAMTAYVAAARRVPSELWLCSLSPYFHEDIQSEHMKKSWLSYIGHRRVAAFDKLIFRSLAAKIRCKTLIFAGAIEMNKWPDMKKRTLEAEELLANITLYIVEHVGHDVADASYTATIQRAISNVDI